MTSDHEWIECSKELPPADLVVMTKIDDEKGCRNEQKLKREGRGYGHSMWFLPDGSMYVYYAPTHWARIKEQTP